METEVLLKDSEVETRQPVEQNHVDDATIMKNKYTLRNDTRAEIESWNNQTLGRECSTAGQEILCIL